MHMVGHDHMFVYFLLLSVFMSAVGGIFNAALYRYACFKQVPPGLLPGTDRFSLGAQGLAQRA